MKISVLVPSYRRPAALQRCLEAIWAQERYADQVLIVARRDDFETWSVVEMCSRHRPIEVVDVFQPGVVHAMNRGLSRCEGDILAITDDDAAPRADWLARIEAHFRDDRMIGGVGGRDWIHENGRVAAGQKALVGRVMWFGRAVGNHHLGVGAARDVDVLKGVNCSFRMEAIRPIGFDERLKGEGAQVHWEMCLCFALRRGGWRLVYDPAVAVDHYPAPRFDRDQRGKFDPQATADRTYNYRLALQEVSPVWRRAAAYAWHYAVGTRDEPGLANLLRMLARRDPDALSRFRAAHSRAAVAAR
jgi:cellulose synthase/poly-beta-1,6-N-acetylglucosamine synthase-like glycosyltransferase